MAKHEGEKDRPGIDEAEDDLKSKPERRTPADIDSDAERKTERRRGGKAEERRADKKEEEKKKRDHMKRRRGGKTVEMHGERHEHHGRKPRKSGGRTGSEDQPFTSARHGTAAVGRKLEKETMD